MASCPAFKPAACRCPNSGRSVACASSAAAPSISCCSKGRRRPWRSSGRYGRPRRLRGVREQWGWRIPEYNGLMVRVEHVLDSWRTIRQDTVAAVEDFPAEEFDFRPVPEVAAFGEIARHILNAGHALTGLMLAGELNFATPDFRERMSRQTVPLPPGAGQAELAAALRESIAGRTEALAAQPAEF